MIKLGRYGEEVQLPELRWSGGGGGELPIGWAKGVDRIVLLSGATRYLVRDVILRRWELRWDYLTDEELGVLKSVAELSEPLRFQINRDDEEWRWVVVIEFKYSSIETSRVYGDPRYRAEMVLEEINKEEEE